jgi:GT2 family glycosyltransferase
MQDSIANTPNVTVIVSARERFSLAIRSLNALISATQEPYGLIYIDAGSPKGVASELKRICAEQGFTYHRIDHYLSPAQSRNRGHHMANTKYVAFVENDVFVADNWLTPLIECAEQTGAEVVQPLICQGAPLHSEIHHGGGNFTNDFDGFFNGPVDARRLADRHFLHQGKQVGDVTLARSETQVCETHCMLVRRDTFERFGDFDEKMPYSKDHVDFSISVWAKGGRIMLEQTSIATVCHPDSAHPLEAMDLPLFVLRWSPKWQRESLDYFRKKWGLQADPYFDKYAKQKNWRYHDNIVLPVVRKIPFVGSSHKVQKMASVAMLPFVSAVGTRLGNRHATRTSNWNSREIQ